MGGWKNMTRDDFCRQHWKYYLILEQDFLATERFVSFDLGDDYLYDTATHKNLENSQVYSVEFVKQYQTICSEVDVIMKSICTELGQSADCIHDYAKHILTQWPDLIKQKVQLEDFQLQPFMNWIYNSTKKSTLDWWVPYNNIKHERIVNFKQANLKNVLNALAGLYILELYLVKYIGDRDKEIDVPDDRSKLFEIVNFTTKSTILGRNAFAVTTEDIDAIVGK